MHTYTFENISDVFPFLIKKGGGYYDKKGILPIYCNSAIILYSNHLTI